MLLAAWILLGLTVTKHEISNCGLSLPRDEQTFLSARKRKD